MINNQSTCPIMKNQGKKLALLVLLLFPGFSFGTNYRFNGQVNRSWVNVVNWTGSQIPPIVIPFGDTVFIAGNCDLDTSITLNGVMLSVGNLTTLYNRRVLVTGATSTVDLRTFYSYSKCTINGLCTIRSFGFLNAGVMVNGNLVFTGGTARINDSLIISSAGQVDAGSSNFGAINTSTVINSGLLTKTGADVFSINGKFINHPSGITRLGLGTNTVLAVGSSGNVTNHGLFTVSSFYNLAINSNSGTIINTGNGRFEFLSFFENRSGGVMRNETGATMFIPAGSGLFSLAGSFNNYGRMEGSGYFHFVRTATYSCFRSRPGSAISPGTGVNGTGTFCIAANNMVGSGLSPVNFDTATYHCDISGTTPGVNADLILAMHLSTTTSTPLGAILTNMSLKVNWQSFTPVAGQRFEIMRFSGRTGQFASVNIPTVPGVGFNVLYTDSNVVLAAYPAVIPLRLVQFSGRLHNQTALLEWTTDNETNTSHFEIENSQDGMLFKKTGWVAARNTGGQHQYTFTHNSVPGGFNFYRLKQVDKDGRFTYSSIVQLKIPLGSASLITMLKGNTVQDQLHILFKGIQPGEACIISTGGNRLRKQQLRAMDESIIWLSGLPGGLYYLTVSDGNNMQVVPFIKK